jgi:hypothetical protein
LKRSNGIVRREKGFAVTTESSSGRAVVLRTGEYLSERAVSSPSGAFSLAHQHDGNLVLYRSHDREAVWASGSNYQDSANLELLSSNVSSRPGRVLLRQNGGLVVLRADGEPVWNAEGSGRTLVLTDAGQILLLADNGDVAWESPQPEPLDEDDEPWDVPWASAPDGRRLRRGQILRGQTLTSADGAFTLVSSEEGFLYLRRVDGPVLWSYFLGYMYGLELSEDGILQVRDWEEGEEQPVGFLALPEDLRAVEMFVDQDGRLTFTDDSGAAIWTGPTPEEMGPYPGLPKPRATIDLDDYDDFNPLVVRTDFDSDDAWNRLESEMSKPSETSADGYDLYVIADPVWSGASPEEVVAALLVTGTDLPQAVFIADQEARQGSMLAVDLNYAESPEEREIPEPVIPRLRIRADQVGLMTVNLAIHNTDFSDWEK